MSKEDKTLNPRWKDLRDTINTAMEMNKSPYQIAITMGLSIGELLDDIEYYELETLGTKYINTQKDILLNGAKNEKQRDLYMMLLEDSGLISSEQSGNDLELSINIVSNEDLVIEEVGEDIGDQEKTEH